MRYADPRNLVLAASNSATWLASTHSEAARAGLKASQSARHTAFLSMIFPKMVEARGGSYVIKDAPPLIYHHPHINLAKIVR